MARRRSNSIAGVQRLEHSCRNLALDREILRCQRLKHAVNLWPENRDLVIDHRMFKICTKHLGHRGAAVRVVRLFSLKIFFNLQNNILRLYMKREPRILSLQANMGTGLHLRLKSRSRRLFCNTTLFYRGIVFSFVLPMSINGSKILIQGFHWLCFDHNLYSKSSRSNLRSWFHYNKTPFQFINIVIVGFEESQLSKQSIIWCSSSSVVLF